MCPRREMTPPLHPLHYPCSGHGAFCFGHGAHDFSSWGVLFSSWGIFPSLMGRTERSVCPYRETPTPVQGKSNLGTGEKSYLRKRERPSPQGRSDPPHKKNAQVTLIYLTLNVSLSHMVPVSIICNQQYFL